MIELTRLNHHPVLVNAAYIVAVEATPDTVLTLATGDKLMVREPPAEIMERASAYFRRVGGIHLVPAHDAVRPADDIEEGV